MFTGHILAAIKTSEDPGVLASEEAVSLFAKAGRYVR
jgi:hypothetical protein